MKTRIIWTKIWEDDWFQSLSDDGQKLFLFLLTNRSINLCGCYQISDWLIKTQTRIKNLEKAKKELYPKVKFFKDWVFIKNAEFYGGYKGEKNEIAKNKELQEIPDHVKTALFGGKNKESESIDTLSIGYQRGINTSINHKSEIINNKGVVKGDDFPNKKITQENKNSPPDPNPPPKKTEKLYSGKWTLNQVAQGVVKAFNLHLKSKFKNYTSFNANLAYWLDIYTPEDIEQAIQNIKFSPFWKDKMTPVILFRRKNPQGEPVDYISQLLSIHAKYD